MYRTLAHELAHLVLNRKDPAQQLGYASSDGLVLSNIRPDMDLIGDAEAVANRVAAPFSSILSVTPFGCLDVFGVLSVILDRPTLATARHAVGFTAYGRGAPL